MIQIDRSDAVAVVRLDRGDGRNALSARFMREIAAAAESFRDDLDTRAIVLTGTSEVFSVGADLKDPELASRRDRGLLERRHALRVGPDMCAAWERVEQFTICAIEGHCIGGGVALAVACDTRIAGSGASLRLPEIPLGMNMSWQSNPRLVNLMGVARAKRFIVLGEAMDAETALAQGLVEDTVPAGQALDAALDLARRVAALPPVGVRMTKQSVDAAAKALNYTASYMDRDQFALTLGGEDQQEAVRAFLEKRAPTFTGR